MPCTPVAKLLNSASAAVEPLDKVLFAWHVCSLSGDGFENVATDSSLTVDLFGAVIGPVTTLMSPSLTLSPDDRDTFFYLGAIFTEMAVSVSLLVQSADWLNETDGIEYCLRFYR